MEKTNQSLHYLYGYTLLCGDYIYFGNDLQGKLMLFVLSICFPFKSTVLLNGLYKTDFIVLYSLVFIHHSILIAITKDLRCIENL